MTQIAPAPAAIAVGLSPRPDRSGGAAVTGEYELLAEWHAERAPLDDDHFVACQAMAVVGIVLREVADAIDVEWDEEADA